jgi:hypothetical protein
MIAHSAGPSKKIIFGLRTAQDPAKKYFWTKGSSGPSTIFQSDAKQMVKEYQPNQSTS